MLMKMRSKMQNQKGFTLVELMVVVVILGILIAIAVPVYNNVTKTANQRAVEANLRTIDGAIMQYEAANPEKASLKDVSTEEKGGALMEGDAYFKVWPEGPDGVEYGVDDEGKAFADGSEAGPWWDLETASDTVTLPIGWK